MAEKTERTPAAEPAAEPVAAVAGDHDRVAMLSIRVDGTPDQTAPELVGPADAARAATAEQLAQKAVSDTGTPAPAAGPEETVAQDPGVAAAQAAHEEVAAAARRAADALVDGLGGA